MPNEDQTQNPEGSGREESPQDALKRLEESQTALAQEKEARKLAEAEGRRLEAERRAFQARADRLTQQLNEQSRQRSYNPNNPAAALAEEQTARRQAELEAEKYRLLSQYNLKEEDLPEGVTYTSPGELVLHVQLASTQKQIRELNESSTRRDTEMKEALKQRNEAVEGEPLAGGSGGLFDTGGRTGRAAPDQQKKLDAAYDKAHELRKGGDRDQGAYLMLRAIHADPSKNVAVSGSEEEELPDVRKR